MVLRLPGVTPGAVANPVHEVLEKAPTRTHDQQPVDVVLVGQDAEGRDSWRGDGTAPRQGELGRIIVLALALRDLQLLRLVFGTCRGDMGPESSYGPRIRTCPEAASALDKTHATGNRCRFRPHKSL